jgi:hypothetical protein
MRAVALLLFCLIMTFILAVPAQAKPLSYVAGTMVMQENDETGHNKPTATKQNLIVRFQRRMGHF